MTVSQRLNPKVGLGQQRGSFGGTESEVARPFQQGASGDAVFFGQIGPGRSLELIGSGQVEKGGFWVAPRRLKQSAHGCFSVAEQGGAVCGEHFIQHFEQAGDRRRGHGDGVGAEQPLILQLRQLGGQGQAVHGQILSSSDRFRKTQHIGESLEETG